MTPWMGLATTQGSHASAFLWVGLCRSDPLDALDDGGARHECIAVPHKRLLLAGFLLVGLTALVVAVRGSSAFRRGLAVLTHRSAAHDAADGKAQSSSEEKYQIVQEIFSSGFKNDWQERGSTRVSGASPADLDLSNYGAWSLRHPTQTGDFDALVLRLKTTHPALDAIEIKLTSDLISLAPVLLMRGHTVVDKDGWIEVTLPWEMLNPERRHFDGLRIRAIAPLDVHDVKVDFIGLARARAGSASEPKPEIPTRDGTVQIDCRSPTTPISPLIFGVANAGDEPRDMMAGAYRFGGNPASRFNWSLGNAWNTGNDWYFQNVNAGPVWEKLIGASLEREVPLTVTIPMLGWVARDDHSYSYPVSVFGAQVSVDPEHPDVGNGVSKRTGPIRAGDPLRTSIPAPPELIGKWVEKIAQESQQRGRPVHSYILDNEPNLWSSTHRDVHPEPLNYDELLDRTIRYGSAIRAADPEAIIAGPAEWGWSNYFWSAKDAASGFALRPDRRAHGDLPLLDWYLSKLREHEAKSGVRVLDVVDLHFYPQGKNLYAAGGEGSTDPETSQRRIRATRSLWDPSYTDESWINERIYLLPRLKEIIERNYPGRRISIGEWNFGAEAHVSGGLATAEALGRFAQAGIHSAYFWLAPRAGTPAYWAFRAYRNFDGQGGTFLDQFVRATSPKEVSIFASRNTDQSRHVIVIVVPSSESSFKLSFRLVSCKPVTAWRTFVYTSASNGLVLSKRGANGDIADVFPPLSIAVLEINTARDEPRDHGG